MNPSWPRSSARRRHACTRAGTTDWCWCWARSPTPHLVDGIRAIGSPQVYLQLVELTGWSPEQYRQWLAQTLFRLLDHIPEETS